MKSIFRISVCMVIMAVTFIGCSSSDEPGGGKKDAKLSPPSWIQGSWGDEDGYVAIFKFTSNDVIYGGISLKAIFGVSVAGSSTSIKETKNSSSEYEITISAQDKKDKASAYFSFKKGDGDYIEAGWDETGKQITSFEKLYKRK